MKRLLVLSILLLTYNANAQKLSLAAGAGGSVNGQPSGNMVYVGDQTLLNYAVTSRMTYTTQSNWQYGVAVHMHETSTKSSKSYPGFPNRHLIIDSVGGDGKKLVYAKNTVAATVVLNRNFNLGTKTSAYLGIAGGWGFARNNSLYYRENESYKAADGGDGFCYGGQIGIVQGLAPKVNFFFDVSFRMYNFAYDAGAPTVRPPEDIEYSIWALPITVGLSFDLYEKSKSSTNTFNKRTRKYN